MSDPVERLVTVEDLRVAFGRSRTEVVHGVSFHLDAGETLALVGESGSGKSVTARSLMALAGEGSRTTAERLEVVGHDLRTARPRELRRLRGRDVGYVLQDALVSLDPLRRIGAEVEDALRLHTSASRAERRARVVELLTRVGIPQPELRAQQHSGALSGGLRQRALIAAAVALEPPVLVADEPTTALDATVQLQILQLLRELCGRGTGLLLISHDLAVVGDLADRVAVMRHGEIVEQGPTRAVLEDPQHPYTQALLRASPTDRPRGTRLTDSVPAVSPTPGRAAAVAAEAAHPGGPVVLEAHGLRRTYPNPDGSTRTAVADVSLRLPRGTTLGIVGESGSGKTTVARMLLGLETPDAGRVELDGEAWSPLPEVQRRPRRHRVRAVYQDPLGSFDPRFSVRRLLREALLATHDGARPDRDRLSARSAELLATVGLDPDLLDRSPVTLSGGQRQRLAIARALASEPDVVICDEPVSALDVLVQAQVLDLLDDLQERLGLSYVFISHDLGVVQHVSDHLLVMKDGQVVEEGPTHRLFTDPQHPYTRGLLAAAPRLDLEVPL